MKKGYYVHFNATQDFGLRDECIVYETVYDNLDAALEAIDKLFENYKSQHELINAIKHQHVDVDGGTIYHFEVETQEGRWICNISYERMDLLSEINEDNLLSICDFLTW